MLVFTGADGERHSEHSTLGHPGALHSTANCNINGHVSIENHTFQGCFLHSFCIFNRKIRNKLAIYIAICSKFRSKSRHSLMSREACVTECLWLQWPNPNPNRQTWQAEVEGMLQWILTRAAMDLNMPPLPVSCNAFAG